MLLLADASRRAGAASLTAVIPYLAYARQDRRARDGSPWPLSTSAIEKRPEEIVFVFVQLYLNSGFHCSIIALLSRRFLLPIQAYPYQRPAATRTPASHRMVSHHEEPVTNDKRA
jgi:hypothetical protein